MNILAGDIASTILFTLQNNCKYTVWPGSLSGNCSNIIYTELSLRPGFLTQLNVPAGWSGRFWIRTECSFDRTGKGECAIGDCFGGLKCIGGGVLPVTLAEFTVGNAGNDTFMIRLQCSYGVYATGRTGNCQYAGCIPDLNDNCPKELQLHARARVQHSTVRSCCPGEHGTPQTCPPTNYSKMFKIARPRAYSYAYDDASSTCTCSGAN
ncbi:hypothetical protein Ahy_B06g086088 [Arachis hypogaea]|uniref:Thaumatin-like protein n=1 Tax=Arachis hypogaea TaxID=3818 RepID=A0A444YWN1_ARAHY|nr:hypothetical protein Ahy_B06g086088 [Arachis hypogaea]